MNIKVQIDEKYMFFHENVMEVIDTCTTKKAHERRNYKAEENLDNKWYAIYNQGKNIPLKKAITSNHQFTFLRIHWGLSRILKTSNKSVWSNIFWYANVYIYSKFKWYTIHWDKNQMLKKFLSDEIDVTKSALFFSFASSNSSQSYL